MEMTISRKILNIAGILDYIAGGLTFLLGAVVMGFGVLAMNDPEVMQEMPAGLGEYSVCIVGAVIAVGAVFTMIYAHLERVAAKNPAKVMPVWVLSIISAVLNVGNLISNFMQHVELADMGGCFAGLAFSILMLIVANNVKREADR